ncbi:hypothetical protein ACFODL_11285 [Phenylobacterium terrae]|uniref:Alpha/beta hydrolase n=1 Tax=Phenylobacterium terrae TaxID=2665495 RepID=A0ABW4MYT7_9CAUL
MRLMHPLRAAEAVRETFDVGRRADGSPLAVDLARPARPGPWPVALLVHGPVPDAMRVTMRTAPMYRDWAAALAASGVASLVFDHTLGWPQLRLDQALGEVDQVLAWVGAEGRGLGLDLARVTAVLVSGGAVLAGELLGGVRPLRPQRAALVSPVVGAPPGLGVSAADLVRRMSLAAAAPTVAAAGARLLILRAGGDQPDWLAMLDEAVAALLAADADLIVDNRPGAPHGYELALDDGRTRTAIEKVLALAAA